jgi:hypothetical protein
VNAVNVSGVHTWSIRSVVGDPVRLAASFGVEADPIAFPRTRAPRPSEMPGAASPGDRPATRARKKRA